MEVVYINYHQGRELGGAFGTKFVASSIIPVSKLKKDYWQEIDMMGHTGEYGLVTQHLNSNLIGKKACVLKSWSSEEIAIAETEDNGNRIISVPAGYEKVIIFPDWEVVEVYINLNYSNGQIKKLKFYSVEKIMSRYIPVIVVSTVDDYLSIDSAFKNTVQIAQIQ